MGTLGGQPLADDEPTAFVDESIRQDPSGLYVVAGVVIIGDTAQARAAATKAPPAGKRFHWKDEREASRVAMLDVLVGLDCGLWSYECRPCPTSKQERARTKCVEQLLWDLQELGVDQLVIESRGAPGDRKDRQAIERAVRSRRASPKLVYEHRRPTHEPALWLADGLAGAAAMALVGRTTYRDHLGAELRRTQLSL